MTAFQLRSKIQNLSFSQRMKTCGRPISSQVGFAALNYADSTSVVVSGRASCRSVLCPSCRPGRMVKRKNEVQTIIESWQNDFKTVSMLTFTAPHTADTSPADFFGSTRYRTGLSGAIALLKQSSFWKESIDGYVSVLESTFGKNGVHAHYHVVVATNGPIQDVLGLSELWQDVCVRAGLGMPSIDRGLTVQNADKIAQYISKWSIDSEMAGAHVKDAKNGNITLSELERYAASGASWARKMLRSYYDFMYRRRSITYSQNLKPVRDAHKQHIDSLWSIVPVFSVDRSQANLSCQDESQIKDVLKGSDFAQDSIDLLADAFGFSVKLPEFDQSSTPESRLEYSIFKEQLDEEFHNVRVILDVVKKPGVNSGPSTKNKSEGLLYGPLPESFTWIGQCGSMNKCE